MTQTYIRNNTYFVMHNIPIEGAFLKFWNGQNEILLSALLNLYRKTSLPSILGVILSRFVLHRDKASLRLSLHCLRDIR